LHLGTSALLDFYRRHREHDSLVLVTIIATEGSTYRKPGAMMLISADGGYEGMISGGCLEGDLLHHASEVFASGEAKFVTYDMHADENLVWSLGLGCDGVIHLLLQRLDRGDGFGFLSWLDETLAARDPAMVAMVTRSDSDELPAGSFALQSRSGKILGSEPLLDCLGVHAGPGWPDWRSRMSRPAGHDAEAMLINVPPQPRVLLCGAGPDAVPVARQITSLGWDCHIVDHRPAFARADRFPVGCTVVMTRPEKMPEAVNLREMDAAVIMSHHLENDAAYLAGLTGTPLRYIGVLGPRARRNRLKKMAGNPDLQIYGPVGLDIGAELPESIALSITAEIHAVLNERDGLSLTPRD
jgi:xanthine/CO dehydrogenase XdhC/CoxF family maturation factor